MNGLKTLGILCILLVCFGPVIVIIIDVFRKPQQFDKNGKRKVKINQVNFWDYLIIIFPVLLILIGIFTNDKEEQELCFNILGCGYMVLILSSYNRRMDIPKINWLVFSTCVVLATFSYILKLYNDNFYQSTEYKNLTVLYFPILAYFYLQISKRLIKIITGTYPITLDKFFRVGSFYSNYQRYTTYWDLVWTLISMIGFLTLIGYLTI